MRHKELKRKSDLLLICSSVSYYKEGTDEEGYKQERTAIEHLRYLAMEMIRINDEVRTEIITKKREI